MFGWSDSWEGSGAPVGTVPPVTALWAAAPAGATMGRVTDCSPVISVLLFIPTKITVTSPARSSTPRT